MNPETVLTIVSSALIITAIVLAIHGLREYDRRIEAHYNKKEQKRPCGRIMSERKER